MATHLQNAPPPRSLPVDDESVDLMEVVVRFLAEWRTGLLAMLLVLAVGVMKVYSLKPQYEASATILPQQTVDASNGLASLLSVRGPSDVYVALLESRTVANEVINRLDLFNVFKTRSRESAQRALAGSSKFVSTGTLIVITVRNTDAQLATRIANAYIDALGAQQDLMTSADATRQQHFYQTQLDKERQALAVAENDLRQQQETTGVVAMDTQTQLGLTAIAQAQAQVTSLQVQLQSQERTLEAGASGSGAGAAPAAGKIPKLNLEYVRKQREVRYHEALFNSLSSHYESARLSGAQTAPQYQVVDRAVLPEERSWPPRRFYLALVLGASVLAGILAIILRLLVRSLRSDPVQAAHLSSIRRNFRVRRRV